MPDSVMVAVDLEKIRPWRPYVAGLNAFFLGPIAGVIVAYLSLSAMGAIERGRKLVKYAIPGILVEIVFLLAMPSRGTRLLGLVVAVANYKLITFSQDTDFVRWQSLPA